jgi:hypothetical protein
MRPREPPDQGRECPLPPAAFEHQNSVDMKRGGSERLTVDLHGELVQLGPDRRGHLPPGDPFIPGSRAHARA